MVGNHNQLNQWIFIDKKLLNLYFRTFCYLVTATIVKFGS